MNHFDRCVIIEAVQTIYEVGNYLCCHEICRRTPRTQIGNGLKANWKVGEKVKRIEDLVFFSNSGVYINITALTYKND